MPSTRPNSLRRRLRRKLLKAFALCGIGLPRLGFSQDVAAGGGMDGPQENDWLVYAFGEREGQRIAVEDLTIGAQQLFAYPQDAAGGMVRNGTRLNQVLVVRLDAASLSEQTAARSALGVVAYSGVCSHTGCDVTDWQSDARRFKCPCHESEFDPSDAARVVGGPAPWQLAALPLKIVDGSIAVAGAFEGRLGFQQPGLDPFGL